MGAWGAGEQVAPMFDLSCASPTACIGMLADQPGFDATFDGTSWTVARALPKGYGGTITEHLVRRPGHVHAGRPNRQRLPPDDLTLRRHSVNSNARRRARGRCHVRKRTCRSPGRNHAHVRATAAKAMPRA